MNSIINNLRAKAGQLFACLGIVCLCIPMLTACATGGGAVSTGSIISDLVTDVSAGAATVLDAQTALSAAQQAMGGHGVSLNNILSYASAEASAANTSGLANAVSTLVSDISSQVKSGATPATIVPELTTAQTQLASSPPASPAPSSSLWHPAVEYARLYANA